MLSRTTLKFLYLSFFVISSVNAANEDEKKKEEKKDVVLDVTATSCENVAFDNRDPNSVVLTVAEGYRFKTLKVGDKTLFNVDTGKHTPVKAFKLNHDSEEWFRLDLHAAQPKMFKKKGDKEYSESKFETYYDEVLFKGKSAKELDASKFEDTSLFTSSAFGTGKMYTFKKEFKPSKVTFEKKEVGKPNNAKYLEVVVFVGSDSKKFVKLYYFYTGDSRLKETYFELKDDKWVQMSQTDANKALNAMNPSWSTDYKPVVDKFSPLAVFASVLIVFSSVLYFL
uniref:Merozoite-piroplasm surface antigen Tams1 n=1 Tax=Theileria annulata TaxID=5874 RepID=Q9N665_THEAN|nr:merozoite-piroplasm surface antigen Tams1 [Theileria annulata]AAF69371.1 merozoite-piroplasm surface antigen Tams1 [Theileria annulata]AAF69372.1 merozoite-piroplasm surface antigen Tams1 [Theileria annulata]